MEIASRIYLRNREVLASSTFSPGFLLKGTNVYEVLRVIEGVPLFLEDHYHRFSVSIQSRMPDTRIEPSEFYLRMDIFLQSSGLKEGNIKIIYHGDGQESYMLIYQVPHLYPDPSLYTRGVETLTVQMIRPDPNYKNWRPDFKKKMADLKKEKGVYEILLSNTNGHITEGSQSNFFLVSSETVYTPPSELILPGITRQKVLAIILSSDIPFREVNINSEILSSADAAFLTGTSPKILPVSMINNITFDVSNPVLRQIMWKYDDLIRKYIQNKI